MDQAPLTRGGPSGENDAGGPRGDSNLPCRGHLKKILNCKSLRVLPPQQEIFSQGEYPHTVCFICSGLVKLTRTESDGKRVILGLRREGWLLGGAALLMERPYIATAETVHRSKVCFVPAERLKQVMDTNAQFSQWISMILSRDVYSGMLGISEKCCFSGRQRLRKFLWELVKAHDRFDREGPIKIQMMLKNWEVAQLLSVSPQHLSRLLKQLENEGIIMRNKGWLILPEPKRLWRPEIASHEFS